MAAAVITIRYIEDGKWKERPTTCRERQDYTYRKKELERIESQGRVNHIVMETDNG